MFKLISLKNRITSLKLIQQRFQSFSVDDLHFGEKRKENEKEEKTGNPILNEEVKEGYVDPFHAVFYSKKQKNKKRELLKKEMTTNPEFFNAFPHLRDSAFPTKEEDQSLLNTDGQVMLNLDTKKSSYFESLKRNYENFETKTEEEKVRENEANFVDAYSRREGPKKYMSREEKEKIHNLIDEKMRELENTGLSREEILLNKPIGIPLKYDKYFQYLKNNKLAREMLIKPGEAFNVDTVLEKALKQDIGPDPSLPADENRVLYKDQLHRNYQLQAKSRLMNRPWKNKLLSSEMYGYDSNYLEKAKIQMNFEKTRPVSFQNPPLSRAQYRKKFMIKNIKKKDISWKNVPLLLKFVNEVGQIMNKYQTRLPTPIQRKVAKTIKHARNMGILSFCDYIKPQDKLPLTSVLTNFYESTVKVVDKQTGRINIMPNPLEKEQFVYSSFDINEARENLVNEKKFEELKNSLNIDGEDLPRTPNENQREWMIAQDYLLKKDTFVNNNKVNEELQVEEEKTFKKVAGKVVEKLHTQNLTECYIYEKTYSIEDIDDTQKYFSIPERNMNYFNEINKLNHEVKKILHNSQILSTSVDYKGEFSRIRSGKDPELDIDQYSSNLDIQMNTKKGRRRSRREHRRRNVIDVETKEEPIMKKL